MGGNDPYPYMGGPRLGYAKGDAPPVGVPLCSGYTKAPGSSGYTKAPVD